MRNNDSAEDIYNSLPVDLFTTELDEFETDSFGNELDNYSSELELEDSYINSPDIDLKTVKLSNIEEDVDERSIDLSGALSQLNLESKNSTTVQEEEVEPISPKIKSPVDDSNSSMWIRCVRCGKKNEIDCNFCGKCGLQIHKTVLIVEPEAEEKLSPEVSRNIKYHYKRPVFCFGPRGNCFTSFSSPSKSVRNVSKFHLSYLNEFREFSNYLIKNKIISNSNNIWNDKELSDTEWSLGNSILKDITIMISANQVFLLNEQLRNNLREYFANISPKDLGSIKMLATQDSVSYLRGEIDQIFHLLVIGKTKEACELCISFNYWDHALIIAKTLEISFYESVMNRFLDSRFSNGHPLRILYLIMTNNENYALEEIRNMIGNQDMPLFVQDIWTILVNFLLRAKHESMIIAKIFEDIGKCLFDRKLFENALVCFIISVLAGSKLPNSEVLQKIDYLIAWFLSNKQDDTINFAAIPILNVLIEKIDSLNSMTILWRSQFIRLSYAQFLHDIGYFNSNVMNWLQKALDYSKSNKQDCGFPNLLVEECSIIEARNLIKTEKKNPSPKIEHYLADNSSNIPDNSKQYVSPVFAEPFSNTVISSYESHKEEFIPTIANLEQFDQKSNYSPVINDNLISDNISLSPKDPKKNDIFDNVMSESLKSPSNSEKSQIANDKQDSGNVFVKLKNWFPSGKTGTSNQENQKQITKAKMGKPNSFRYDEKLKKWVDDNDPSTFEQAPKLPPPPTIGGTSSINGQALPAATGNINFRAKKGKVKYFDPLNPEGPSSTQLQPSVLDFN